MMEILIVYSICSSLYIVYLGWRIKKMSQQYEFMVDDMTRLNDSLRNNLKPSTVFDSAPAGKHILHG